MSEPTPGSTGLGVAAVLTVSDRASRGEFEDRAGPAVAALLRAAGFEVAAPAVLPDDADRISAWLRARADEDDAALVVTAGGTGLTPRDRTPQATEAVLDYRVDGIAEAMRAASIAVVPTAMLSRAVAGVRGRTLILNLPGQRARRDGEPRGGAAGAGARRRPAARGLPRNARPPARTPADRADGPR